MRRGHRCDPVPYQHSSVCISAFESGGSGGAASSTRVARPARRRVLLDVSVRGQWFTRVLSPGTVATGATRGEDGRDVLVAWRRNRTILRRYVGTRHDAGFAAEISAAVTAIARASDEHARHERREQEPSPNAARACHAQLHLGSVAGIESGSTQTWPGELALSGFEWQLLHEPSTCISVRMTSG